MEKRILEWEMILYVLISLINDLYYQYIFNMKSIFNKVFNMESQTKQKFLVHFLKKYDYLDFCLNELESLSEMFGV